MRILKIVLVVFVFGSVLSCGNEAKKSESKKVEEAVKAPVAETLSKSDRIIREAIQAHGGDLYKTAKYSFVFRGNTYQFENNNSKYKYIKSYKKSDSIIRDELNNGQFSRFVSDTLVALSDKDEAIGRGAVNSVIYFATLPYKLQDPAVNSKWISDINIKGQSYHTIRVTFNEEGGGEDYDDEYFYWINTQTKKIDYLAYSFHVNDGGVRFREAYNKRVVGGITFQDYINYKADVGTPLQELPKLFEANKLEELSRIETEKVQFLE